MYWHLSANALTTFLLTGDQVEAITSDFSQLIALETWIKTWKKDYPTDKKETNKPPLSRGAGGINPQNETEGINTSQTNQNPSTEAQAISTPPFERGAGGIKPQTGAEGINSVINDSSQTSTPPLSRGAGGINPQNEAEGINSTWRARLGQRLETLKILLSIPEIETKLAQFAQINRLILIPHRDLHLFPLDSLFANQYTISYLPSIQVGINLLAHPTNPENRLLSIENPDSSLSKGPLIAVEIESELISQMYSSSFSPNRLQAEKTTLKNVREALLDQSHNILHFTGHAYYDFNDPMQSALALSQTDRLTLAEITCSHESDLDLGKTDRSTLVKITLPPLNLKHYKLACLCACETAIAGNQNITTEYVGIVSAFIHAGVTKVVSTLWTVQDVSSAILMVEFHRHRLAGRSEAEALKEAKDWLSKATSSDLDCWYQQAIDRLSPKSKNLRWLKWFKAENAKIESQIKPYEDPYYWAAFTLTGL